MNELPPADSNNEEPEETEDIILNPFDPESWTNQQKEKDIDDRIKKAEKLIEEMKADDLDYYNLDFNPDLTILHEETNDWLKGDEIGFNDIEIDENKPYYMYSKEERQALEERRKRTEQLNEARDKIEKNFKNPNFDLGLRASKVVPTFQNEPGRAKLVIVESGLLESNVEEIDITVKEYGMLLEKILMIDNLVDGDLLHFRTMNYMIDQYSTEEQTTKQMVAKLIVSRSHPEFDQYSNLIFHFNLIHETTIKKGYRPGTYDVCLECFVSHLREYRF